MYSSILQLLHLFCRCVCVCVCAIEMCPCILFIDVTDSDDVFACLSSNPLLSSLLTVRLFRLRLWSPDLPRALFFAVCSRSFFMLFSGCPLTKMSTKICPLPKRSARSHLKERFWAGDRSALFRHSFLNARSFYGNF